MEAAICFLCMYMLGVVIYTIVVKNDTKHQFCPFTDTKSIIIDGMKCIGIGFIVTAIVLYLISVIYLWFL